MKKKFKNYLIISMILFTGFLLWTHLVMNVDVKMIGESNTNVGFSSMNMWFHELTGVNMFIYEITDWLSLIPIGICLLFGCIGLTQLLKRKNLFKVDCDILILGVFYIAVVGLYLLFEFIPINYRPILINGMKEVSYPSSTTLLVLCVMLTFHFQCQRRINNECHKKMMICINVLFSCFMVIGRLVSGVHWISDIIGSLLLSFGLYYIFKSTVMYFDSL